MVMKDCNFYCCHKLKHSWSVLKDNIGRWMTCDEGGYTAEEILYCPFCGSKLR